MSLITIHDYAIKHKIPIKRALEIASPYFDDVLTKYYRVDEDQFGQWIKYAEENAEENAEDPIEKIGLLLKDIEKEDYVSTRSLGGAYAALKASYEKIQGVKKQSGLLKIAVAGLHSAGKSTFVNSLLDQIEQIKERGPDYKKIIGKLAPSGAAPTTRIITSFVFSEKPYYRDSDSQSYTLEQYQKKAIDQDFKGRFEVGVNNPLLKGVELMDVPGLFADEKDDAVVQSVLDEVDILFWLVDINDGTIKDNALNGLKQTNKPIVIIVTQVQGKDRKGFDEVFNNIKAEAEKNKLYVSAWNWFSADDPTLLKPGIRDIVKGKRDELKKFIQTKAQVGNGATQKFNLLESSFKESMAVLKNEAINVKNRLKEDNLEDGMTKAKDQVASGIRDSLKSYFRNLLTNVFDYSDVISDVKISEGIFRDDYKMTVTRCSWGWEKLLNQVKNLNKEIRAIVDPYTLQDLKGFRYQSTQLSFYPALWGLQSIQVTYSWGPTFGGGYSKAIDEMRRLISRHIDSYSRLDVLSEHMAKPVVESLNENLFTSKQINYLKDCLKKQTSIENKLDEMIGLLTNLEG